MMDRDWTVAELRAAVVSGETTAADICDQSLKRIGALDPHLNAFTAVFEDAARARADDIDRHRDWMAGPTTAGCADHGEGRDLYARNPHDGSVAHSLGFPSAIRRHRRQAFARRWGGHRWQDEL